MAKKKARLVQEQQQDTAKKDDQQQHSQDDQPSNKEFSSSASSEPISTPASIASIFASSSGIGGGSSVTSTTGAAGDINQGSNTLFPDQGPLVCLSTDKIENELVPPPPPRSDKWVLQPLHNILLSPRHHSSHHSYQHHTINKNLYRVISLIQRFSRHIKLVKSKQEKKTCRWWLFFFMWFYKLYGIKQWKRQIVLSFFN